MSIIIKGMDMPQDCYDCRFECEYYDSPQQRVCGLMRKKVESYDRPSWCPLVEINSPIDFQRFIDGEIQRIIKGDKE